MVSGVWCSCHEVRTPLAQRLSQRLVGVVVTLVGSPARDPGGCGLGQTGSRGNNDRSQLQSFRQRSVPNQYLGTWRRLIEFPCRF